MRRGSLVVVFALVSASVFGLASPTPAAEPSFPEGFRITTTDSGQGQFNLTDFVFLPRGGFLTAGKNGKVTHVDGTGMPTTIGQIAVASDGDMGLLGIDLATDYSQSGKLYAVYSYARPTGDWAARLVRWTVDNPAAPRNIVNEVAIVDGIDQTFYTHTIGQVVVDTDGTIWFAMGDASNPFKTDPMALRAQDLNVPQGKLFHVNPNGTGVVSNPFYNASEPSSWKSRIWAYGFRNPFRFALHPDGTPYVADVGQNLREEMNIGVKGGNHGWPCWEGNEKNSFQSMPECQALYAAGNVVRPLFDYGRLPKTGTSITGGAFAWGDTYPEPYANSMIFGEFVEQKLWTFETNAAHELTRAPEGGTGSNRTDGVFAQDVGGPVSFRRGPTGEIHYADIYTGHIVRVSYAAGNRPPTARARAETSYGNTDVKFIGSESSDPDGDQLSYEWEFGDGSPRKFVADPAHQYPRVDRYTAKLTVRDGKGGEASKTVDVVLDDHEPTLLVTWPPAAKTYAVDEPIAATASASDVEDSDLTSEDVNWRADIVHCASTTSCHTHPGRASTGATFSMPFPDHGSGVSVKVTAWVEDSVGHRVVRSFDAKPRLRTLTVTSQGAVLLNGDPLPAGGQVALVAGSRNVVQALDAVNARFTAWTGTAATGADPSANPMTFTMPLSNSTLTAQYRSVSLAVSFSGGTSSPLYAHVAPQGQPGDSYPAPTGAGCRIGALAGGDDGDGRMEVGETWTLPCYPGPRVQAPNHPISVNAATGNGGVVTGSGVVPVGLGYRMVATDGGIFSFGEAPFFGSMGGQPLNQPIIGMAATPTGNGYWMVASDGGMFSFGDAGFFGSKGGQPLPAPIVAMVPTRTGMGYWLAGADGSVYPFGDARDYGSLAGVRLARPIVGITTTDSGNGYWMVASDGGIFAFGDAPFFGSMGGQPLNQPIVGMAPTASGNGYWQVASDGGMFSFGDAPFFGSMGGQRLNQPVVGMAVSPGGDGYWQVATDGGMFSFGDAPFFGSMGGQPLNQPVNGMTSAVIAKLG